MVVLYGWGFVSKEESCHGNTGGCVGSLWFGDGSVELEPLDETGSAVLNSGL